MIYDIFIFHSNPSRSWANYLNVSGNQMLTVVSLTTFTVSLQQSSLSSSQQQQQPLTSGLYQRQPRAANPVTNRAIRRHIREQVFLQVYLLAAT